MLNHYNVQAPQTPWHRALRSASVAALSGALAAGLLQPAYADDITSPPVPLLLSAPIAAGGDGARLLWEDQFDRAGGDDFHGIRHGIAVDGPRVFAAGRSQSASGDFDFFLRAYDTRTGGFLWADYFDKAGGEDVALTVSAGGGRVFAVGYLSNAAGTRVLALRAYDGKTGALLWEDQIDPGGGFFSAFEHVAVHGETVFAVGTVRKGPGNRRRDWIVRAYDAKTGALRWQDEFDRAGGHDRARFVAVHDDRVFVTGTAQIGAPDNFGDFYVRAYDATAGTLLWQDHADGIGVFGDGVGIAVAGGRVFVSGTVLTQLDPVIVQDWLVRAYDTKTGTLLWEDQFNKGGGTTHEAYNIAFSVVARGSRVFAAGPGGADCILFRLTSEGNCDFLVRGYDARTGTVLWEDQHDRNNGTDDIAHGIAADRNRVFAVGFGGNDCAFNGLSTNCDLLLRAYGARTGQLLWEDQVDKAGGDDSGHSVVAQRGRVFVAGETALAGAVSTDLLVRGYDARGSDADDDHDD